MSPEPHGSIGIRHYWERRVCSVNGLGSTPPLQLTFRSPGKLLFR